MSLWKIAWRSIQQRKLSSLLTGLSIALGVALVVIVLVIHGVVSASFSEAAQGYHLILGAKGGKLQLTLNTVFHLSQPIENVPYSFFKEFTEYQDESGNRVRGKYASAVEAAIPYCLGDSYKDFRVVGTTPDLFEKLSYGAYPDGTPKQYQFAEGSNFDAGDFNAAVIGAVAARQAGLKVGDHFPITHGIADENAKVHDEDLFHVVGILAPTGTPNDRAVFVNMEGFYLISDHAKPLPKQEESIDGVLKTHLEQLRLAHNHLQRAAAAKDVPEAVTAEIKEADQLIDEILRATKPQSARPLNAATKKAGEETEHDGAEKSPSHQHPTKVATGGQTPLPENQREVTAVLLLLKNDVFSQVLYNKINEGNVAQAVFPSREVTNLFEGIVGHIRMILLVLAVLVVVVAGVGVMVSIYNSMNDRRREIGIMRALGAARSTVMSIVLMESVLLALLGGMAGVILGHVTIGLFAPFVTATTGVMIHFWQLAPAIHFAGTFISPEVILIPALLVLATIVGFLPALIAYRTDVARALSDAP